MKDLFEKFKNSEGFVAIFFRFLCSSAGTSIIDLVLFQIFLLLFNPLFAAIAVYVATAIARIISATLNYVVNKKLVFKSDAEVVKSGTEFAILTVVKTVISAVAVDILSKKWPSAFWGLAVGWKIIVDILLFFFNFFCQKCLIFIKMKKSGEND